MWFQKISIPPHRRDLPYDPPPLWIFQNRPSKFTPPLPSRISKIFAHPLEILLSLTEVNKEVVLFPRMPNFVSFVYFLLNCITDKRIPYENSLCAQVTDKFCAFHVISIEFYNSANEMQGSVGNMTVLFSYCIKKKASLEEVWLTRSGPRGATRQCEYRISFYEICIFEFAVKLRIADVIDKKIVTQSLTCWKRLV